MLGRRTRITRHRSPLGQWEMVRAQPDARLHPYVRGYCGYEESTFVPLRRRELPGGHVSLIVNLGEPLRLLDPRDPSGGGEERTSFVTGLSDSYALTETKGAQKGLQVDLTPFGGSMVFGVPMHELANQAVRLEDIMGSRADHVVTRVREATTWEARFDLLDAIIGDWLSDGRQPSAGVVWAWRTLNATRGRVGIGSLASELGWSRRHLASAFRRQVGLTPKLIARIFRFRRAVGLLERTDGMSLAEIAQESGYFDQAHLNRDFRQFAGCTPLGFRARRLPDGGGLAGN